MFRSRILVIQSKNYKNIKIIKCNVFKFNIYYENKILFSFFIANDLIIIYLFFSL